MNAWTNFAPPQTPAAPVAPQIVDGDCYEPPWLTLAWFFGWAVPYKTALLPVSGQYGSDWVEHLLSCRYKTECGSCPFRR